MASRLLTILSLYSLCHVTIPYFYSELDHRHKNKADEQYLQDKNRTRITIDNRLKKYQSLKTIVWFNKPSFIHNKIPFGGDFFQTCAVKTCEFLPKTPKTLATSDAIVFHAVDLPNVSPPKRIPQQTWIFFGLEPPFNYKSHVWASREWNHLFNWTMTYRFDSEITHPYSVSRVRILPERNYDDVMREKTKLIAWTVSNCHAQSRRLEYVRQLQDYFKVDIFGKCGNLACNRVCFKDISKRYKFYLAFENSFCKDYITEKFFRTQNLDVVAIVRGGGDYSKFYAPGTYINTADFSSVRELAAYIQYLDQNDSAYIQYLREKAKFIAGGNVRALAFCEICRKLHDIDNYARTISNVSDWLNTNACHSPTDLSAYMVDEAEMVGLYVKTIEAKQKGRQLLPLDI